ncbi:hypothetical protein BJ165DRAFT_349039 [Panaeolus papilionaceus]|nr:hypothetical protein BJ165DRAFT_349039 [Panaeolus papilionaceus]
MTSKDPISTLETDTQTKMRTDIATDILRQIFEMVAEDDMRFARDVLVYVNREVRAWIDLLLYRSLSLHSVSQVHLLTQSLISKSQCPHQSHTFPALTQATHTLLLPTVSVHADVVYLLSALKGVRNLSWAPERRVGGEVRGLVMGLRLERLWTRLSTFMDDPYDISDSEDGSTSVLPPGMLDNVTHLTLVDPIEDWAKWDWKAILASRKGGIEGLKWISVCAAKSHVRLEREMMWEYMEPPSADKEFFCERVECKK